LVRFRGYIILPAGKAATIIDGWVLAIAVASAGDGAGIYRCLRAMTGGIGYGYRREGEVEFEVVTAPVFESAGRLAGTIDIPK
jgi:hypothetical protein